MNKNRNIKKGLLIGCGISFLLLVGFLSSYAFFVINTSNQNEEVNVQTGTLALTFADGNDAITESLEFGASVEKTFTIENTGTLDAWAKINFEDLVNTYLDGSLTFTLSYSESENGEYTDLITNKNMPRSETSSTKEIVNSLSIPAGAKYFYKLKITLNYLELTDQTNDLNAIFSTHFKLEQGSAKYTITFDDGSGENTTKEVIENATYGELPTPTKTGFVFAGWFTEPNGKGKKITSDTQVNIKENQTLYAFLKESFTQSLIAKANDATITSYTSGNKGEMYTFSHPATSQTPALTDYRYIGASPNNYITFNNETWRIIGVFSVENEKGEYEQSIKIIRDNSIGNIKWNESNINDWEKSTLFSLLNSGAYFNKTGDYTTNGLTDAAKKQINYSVWYLGTTDEETVLSAPDYYNTERSSVTCVTSGKCSSQTRNIKTLKNVGLMYPSDYVYTFGDGVDNMCFTNGYTCGNNTSGGKSSTSWLQKAVSEWTITPSAKNSMSAFQINNQGRVLVFTVHNYTYIVRPVVYLRPDIEITGGEGTSSEPYTLKVPTE